MLLGSNKIARFFGLDKDFATKTKEDIYKVAIAASELAKDKIGALIVIERDIKIKDIISTGITLLSSGWNNTTNTTPYVISDVII